MNDEKKAMSELKKSIKRDESLWEGALNDFTLRRITHTEEFQRLDPSGEGGSKATAKKSVKKTRKTK